MLTEAAGMTHGSLYSQFGSKERLVEEALEHAIATSGRTTAGTATLHPRGRAASRLTPTCCVTPAALRWPMRGMIRGLFRIGLGIGLFSTPSSTPNLPQPASRTFGGSRSPPNDRGERPSGRPSAARRGLARRKWQVTPGSGLMRQHGSHD